MEHHPPTAYFAWRSQGCVPSTGFWLGGEGQTCPSTDQLPDWRMKWLRTGAISEPGVNCPERVNKRAREFEARSRLPRSQTSRFRPGAASRHFEPRAPAPSKSPDLPEKTRRPESELSGLLCLPVSPCRLAIYLKLRERNRAQEGSRLERAFLTLRCRLRTGRRGSLAAPPLCRFRYSNGVGVMRVEDSIDRRVERAKADCQNRRRC
jgi:hypothetical protein